MPNGIERYEHVLKHARWAEYELPKLVGRQTRVNRAYTYAGAVVSAITGLSVWPVIEASTAWWAKAIVTVLGLAGALATAIPSIANWRDRVNRGRELSLEAAKLMDQALQTDKGNDAKVTELFNGWLELSKRMTDAELDIGEPPADFR